VPRSEAGIRDEGAFSESSRRRNSGWPLKHATTTGCLLSVALDYWREIPFPPAGLRSPFIPAKPSKRSSG